jgi:hypothetical protein
MAQIDLTNETGKKMLSWVAPIYKDSLVMKIIYQALGMEWGSAEEMIENIKAQFNPLTATWSLGWWEDAWSLLRKESAPYEQRRTRIIAKMQQSVVVNPDRLEKAIEKVTGKTATIVHAVAYTFAVQTRILTAEQEAKARAVIEDMKPAHKSYLIETIYNHWSDVEPLSWARVKELNWWQVLYEDLGTETHTWDEYKILSWAAVAAKNWAEIKGGIR